MGDSRVIRVGEMTLDTAQRQVQVGDRTTKLTAKETELLAYLASRVGQAVARERVFADVWGYDLDCNTNSLDVYVYRLRRYLEQEPSRPKYLQTVRGYGYRFADPSAPSGTKPS
jgi:DNA-binding response OmpR family regulator